MARKKKQTVDTSGSGFGGSAFADLLKAQGLVAEDAVPSADPIPTEATKGGSTLAVQGKLILRRTSKGRAGKTVTLVEGLAGIALEPLAKQIRGAVGCGSSVEEDAIVVQGDQRDRLATWLATQGVKQIVKS